MNLRKRLEVSVILALVFSLLFSILSFAKTSERVRSDVLRLHVIANSDSIEDQNLKLLVRDAILSEEKEIFDGSVDIENVVEKIKPKIPFLQKIAEEVINKNGFNYKVVVTLSREYFNTRTYDTVTLPAGKYLALKIVIGTGEGHNWWCVMFPAMCLPAADKHTEVSSVLDKTEVRLVEKSPKYEVRFKVIEIYEEIKNKIHS